MFDYKKEVVNLTRNLVSIQSYSGAEKKVGKFIKDYAEKYFDSVTIDDFGNVLLEMDGSLPGKTILLDGHMDTVEVDRAEWQTDPFSPVEKAGKLYGRGSSDMKGALASLICGVINFVDQVKHDFKGKIVVSASVHEETLEGVSSRLISQEVKPDLVIIGEATGLKINQGQRGRAEIIIESLGKPAHSANPEKGINAVQGMVSFINEMNKLKEPADAHLGKGISVITDIISAPYPGKSIVPANCKITIDRRLLVGETIDSVLTPYKQIAQKIKLQNPAFSYKVYISEGNEKCYTGKEIKSTRFFPAWFYPENESFIKSALAAVEKIGLKPTLSHYSFCTNASHFAGEAHIPTLGFGPSYEYLAHINDEFIEVDQLYQACAGYTAILTAEIKNLN